MAHLVAPLGPPRRGGAGRRGDGRGLPAAGRAGAARAPDPRAAGKPARRRAVVATGPADPPSPLGLADRMAGRAVRSARPGPAVWELGLGSGPDPAVRVGVR